MGSIAQDIGARTGVSPALVQLFMSLSTPVRVAMKNYFNSVLISLEIAKNKALYGAKRGDKLATNINALRSAISTVLEPADSFMRMFHLDSVVSESEELKAFADVIKKATDSIPFKIPSTVATVIAGIGGFDLFEGVSNYNDLRNKIDELNFRLARAASLSNYANTLSFIIDNQIKTIQNYISILDLIGV